MGTDLEESASQGDDRLSAARALQVVRRLVSYASRDERAAASVRHGDRVCLKWMELARSAGLEPDEIARVDRVRETLSQCTDGAPAPLKLALYAEARASIDELLNAISVDVQVAEPEAAAVLLPPGQIALIEQVRAERHSRAAPPREKVPQDASPRERPSQGPGPKDRRRGRGPPPEREAVAPPERAARVQAEEGRVSATSSQVRAVPVDREPGDLTPDEDDLRAELESLPVVLAAEDVLGEEDEILLVPPGGAASSIIQERLRRWEGQSHRGRPDVPAMTETAAVEAPPDTQQVRRYLRDPEGAGRPLEPGGMLTPAALEALQAAGIRTYADLLLRAPIRQEVLPRAVEPSEPMAEGTSQVARGTVKLRFTRLGAMGSRFEVHVTDGVATVVCRWVTPVDEAFRQRFHAGSRVAVHGRVEHDGDITLLLDGELVWVDSRGQGRQAVYDIPGIPDEEVRMVMRWAVDEFADGLLDPLPEDSRRNIRLLDLSEAVRRLHFPTQGHRRGRERLAFDELLLYQLGMGLRRRSTAQERGSAHVISHKLVAQVQQVHNIVLSDEQEAAFSEIRRDLVRPRPMNRLLQGDVGAGKGAVALLTAVMVAENREQVVFLAPDGPAAEHRFLFAEPILNTVGLQPILITEQPTTAQTEALRSGDALIVYGTHAMTRAWPTFRRLGLVIVEEREAYGVASLADLPGKGGRPDLLVLSNAPLPTSIALTVFGDMDLSLVTAPGLIGAQTEVFQGSERKEAYVRAFEELAAGRQVYVVLPLRNGQEPLDMRDLARFADVLRSEAFPGHRIGLFTGLMSKEERQRTYEDFRHRRIDVLLTTTIIEDGPVVSAATSMVVEQADRFDLVRMHRLRAHVSRGVRQGRFLLVLSDEPETEGVARVELLGRERDGFRIAEFDLLQRGAATLLGQRAKEMPSFRYVDTIEHRELLVRARTEAFTILNADPTLSKPDVAPLRAALEESWQRWFPGQPTAAVRKTPAKGQRSSRRRRHR
jgi:ATP-dependent DNA helicase RecG